LYGTNYTNPCFIRDKKKYQQFLKKKKKKKKKKYKKKKKKKKKTSHTRTEWVVTEHEIKKKSVNTEQLKVTTN
jgi:hypothetical protein